MQLAADGSIPLLSILVGLQLCLARHCTKQNPGYTSWLDGSDNTASLNLTSSSLLHLTHDTLPGPYNSPSSTLTSIPHLAPPTSKASSQSLLFHNYCVTLRRPTKRPGSQREKEKEHCAHASFHSNRYSIQPLLNATINSKGPVTHCDTRSQRSHMHVPYQKLHL
jgi:hypothetical protein